MDHIYQYTVSFDELKLDTDRIVKTIGYNKKNGPAEIIKLIDNAFELSKGLFAIEGGYIIIDDIELDTNKSVMILNKIPFNPENIILRQIKQSTSIAVFLCTIGPEMEHTSKELYKSGDSVLAYIMDSIASETVEMAMDIIQDKLADQMKQKKMHITNRFSPGYCGWKVSEQKKLFSLLPEGFCGISLNPSFLMVPIKSVSGIIGIGKDVKNNVYPCKFCDMKDCIKRRIMDKSVNKRRLI